jgi:hypothetical protein
MGLGATFYAFVSTGPKILSLFSTMGTETLSSRGVELTAHPNLGPRLQKGLSCTTHLPTDTTILCYRVKFASSGHWNRILIPDPSKGFFLSFYTVHIGSEAHIGS